MYAEYRAKNQDGMEWKSDSHNVTPGAATRMEGSDREIRPFDEAKLLVDLTAMAAGDAKDRKERDTDTNGADDAMGQGSNLQEFKELSEMRTLISGLNNVCNNQIALEMSCERITFIVDQYQEQPHLIDPHLEILISDLLSLARNPKSPAKVFHESFKYLYLITKMRGYKVVVRHLPHEVSDVEPVLQFLADQDPYNFGTWETRYMLLLWLSIVCMIPFDMARLDSNIRSQTGEMKKPVMDRILDVGRLYLPMSDKSSDASGYMLSHFLTRPDVKQRRLPEVLDWALLTLTQANQRIMMGMSAASGVLRMLALLFKQGKREDLLSSAPAILKTVGDCELLSCNNTVLRKLAVKLVQRLGLIFLKYRVAAWRYQRGSRSLADNLKVKSADKLAQPSPGADEEDEEYDIPDEIEDVIEQLLGGLKDKDTVVRWSAAKGIGRVTGRLVKDLADEVVGSVLELFTLQESDGAWHGGCLALAELGRRGLLLPQRLTDVVPVVLRALAYDERRGNFSVGAHVRDAACYVCWAFARAYEPHDISLHVNNIANALVIASIFDREVNVRRAAAAAFQENVGRQGTFPHGIDILTMADYYAVGNRTHCYLEISVFVAQFPDYTQSLIDHLVNVKLAHWDSAMRVISAEALHNLTLQAPDYMAKTVLPMLLPKTTGIDLFLRHGSILAIGEVVHAMGKIASDKGSTTADLIGKECVNGLKEIAKKLHDGKLFRGLGGELMRKAVSALIERLSFSKLPYHNDPIIDLWQEIIDDCLRHTEPEVQRSVSPNMATVRHLSRESIAAASAIQAFFTEYYCQPDGTVNPKRQETVIEKYLSELRSGVEITRKTRFSQALELYGKMGFSLAIGALPHFMLKGKLKSVLAGLVHASSVTPKEQKWAESRRDAIKALTSLCRTVEMKAGGSPDHVLCEENISEIYEALLTAMKDYTLDSRGDVGACVREAGMSGLSDLTRLLVQSCPSLIQPSVIEAVFCCLVQQACEKIDRTRAHAGHVFNKLLHHSPVIPYVPHREELEKLFPRENIQQVSKGNEGMYIYLRTVDSVSNWAAPAETFPKFTKLLAYPVYTYPVLLGLTVSVGGLTESLVKSSSSSLYNYVRTLSRNEAELDRFSNTLLQIFRDYQKVDRVSIPMFKTIDQLLARDSFKTFNDSTEHSFPDDLLDVCKKEIAKSGDPQKLMASTDVFCGMLLQFPKKTRDKALTQLLIFLCHKYPRVRKTTANKLYEAFVTFDDFVPDECMEEVMQILSETNWDENVEVLRPIRNRLCDLLNVQKPVVQPKKVKT